MATIYSVTGGSPVVPARSAQTAAPHRQVAEAGSRFDQVALSSEPSGERRFRLQLVSRLSQEVRSTVSTGDIQELRRQVEAHEYKPDCSEIAARMLLTRGVDA